MWNYFFNCCFFIRRCQGNLLITAEVPVVRILGLPSSVSLSSWPCGLYITLCLLWLYFICLNRWRTKIILRRWVDLITKCCAFCYSRCTKWPQLLIKKNEWVCYNMLGFLWYFILYFVLNSTKNISKKWFLSSSGISSSLCLNSGNPHLFRRDLLAERKWRDGYNCRCRDLYTRNQGNTKE